MNNVSIDDKEFISSSEYKEFMKRNPSYGFLKIRVYTASEAVPISNLKIVVSTEIGNKNVIFYEGYSNDSGVIENITLPAPKLNSNNLDIPSSTEYTILATFVPDNISETFKVNMFEDVSVVQNINILLRNVEGF